MVHACRVPHTSTMALITIQPSPSYSPGKAAAKKRRRPKLGTSDPTCCPALVGESPQKPRISYPFCLSARFLVLATLITVWVSFFQNFQSHQAALIPAADGAWSALDDVILSSQRSAAGGGGRNGVRRGRVAGRDGTDDVPVPGEGCQDTAAAPANRGAPNGNNDERHRASHDSNGQPASAAAVSAAATTSAATNDDDNESDQEDDDEDIDLDTLLFVENRI